MIRILLVDDQNIILQGLQALLKSRPNIEVVGTAKNGFQALEQVEALRPDLVLIDIEMPVMDGITATKKICQQFPTTKVLVLSGYEDEKYATQILQAGAEGYVLKSTLAEDLEKAIWLAYRGLSQLEPKLLKKIIVAASVSKSISSHKSRKHKKYKPKSVQITSSNSKSNKDFGKKKSSSNNLTNISVPINNYKVQAERANSRRSILQSENASKNINQSKKESYSKIEDKQILIKDKQNLSNAWKVFQITCLAVFATSLDSTILFVAFPSIQNTFSGASTAQLSWILNAYTILFASSLVTTGRLSDRFGRRKFFLWGMGIYTIASWLCGLAPSLNTLIVARAIQAIGAAMLAPSSLGLILAAFPKSKRSTAISLWGAIGALAAAVGPPLGGAIVQTLGWQWTFFLNIPVGLVVILIGNRLLIESRDLDTNALPDVVGIIMSIAAMSLLTLGIVQSSDWGWRDDRILWSLVIGGVMLWMFLRRSAKVKFPAINLQLFKDPNYRFANLSTFVFSIAFNAMFFGLMLFLTQVWQYSSLDAGIAITPGPLLVIIVSIVTGRIADARGHRILIVPGSFLFALGGTLMYAKAQTTPSLFALWIPAILLIGLGVGFALPALYSSAVYGLSSNFYGIGSAVNQAIIEIGSSLGVSLTVALVGKPSSNQLLSSFDRVFVLLVVGGLLTSLTAMYIKTKPNIKYG